METLLKILDFIGSRFSQYQNGKLDREIKSILQDALSDPGDPQRNFDDLLHETAIFEDEPVELRKHLIILGARKFPSDGQSELWGYPDLNAGSKAEQRFPLALLGLLISLTLGIAASLVTAWIFLYVERLPTKIADICPINPETATGSEVNQLTQVEIEVCGF